MIIKRAGSTVRTVRVTFRLPPVISAESVHLVGDFNGWDRRSHPLERLDHTDAWEISLELARGRTYQFRYLVNGEHWHNDWSADRYVPNPFGGDNSVVET